MSSEAIVAQRTPMDSNLSSTASTVSKPVITSLRAEHISVREGLFKDMASLSGERKRDQVFTLLRNHDSLYSKEGHVLGLTGLSAYISELRDEGYLIDTLRQGRVTQYVLKTSIPDEALKEARAQEKRERADHLKDDKEQGYRAADIKETDALTLVACVPSGCAEGQFNEHPAIRAYPASVRTQLWRLCASQAR